MAAVLDTVRGAYGACQLFAPQFLAGRVLDLQLTGAAPAVVRVLGARHLLQAGAAALLVRWGVREETLRVTAVVDFLHAASMVALALVSRRWRAAAANDAVIATLFGLAQARTTTPTTTRRKGRI